MDAILTGIGTIEADDALLTARGVPRVRRVARRIIVDSRLRLSLSSALVKSAHVAPVMVFCEAERLEHDAAQRERAEVLRAAGVDVRPARAFSNRLDLRAILEVLSREHDVTRLIANEQRPRYSRRT